MEQTIVLPIALGSKVYTVIKKFNTDTGKFEQFKINNITITEVVLFRDGKVRHYISGNHRYLPSNVFQTKEEAERAIDEFKSGFSDSWF